MKILVSLLKYPPDFTGAGMRIEKMYTRLLEKRHLHRVCILTTTERINIEKTEKRGEIEIFYIIGNAYIKQVSSIIIRIKKVFYVFISALKVTVNYFKLHHEFDVIHTIDSSWISTLVGWLAFISNKPHIKEIVLIDTDDPLSIKKSKLPIIRGFFLFPFHNAKIIITISNKLKELCILAGIPEQKIWARLNPVYTESVLPNAIDFFNIDMIASDSKNILFVGTLIERKNIEYLLESAFYLEGNVKLFFVGPSESQEYFNKISDLSLMVKEKTNNKVKSYFTGMIADRAKLAAFFMKSDVFWFASLREGMGNVVIESLLYGTPVVTLPVCGIMHEIINSPEEGEIVNEGATPQEFATVVNKYLYKRKNDRITLMNNTRKRFDPNNVENNYIKIFKELAYKK